MKNSKSQNILFWTLQLIGWGIPTLINMIGKLLVNKSMNKAYIFAEAAILFFFGIVFSTIYRHFIKRQLQQNQKRIRLVVKIIFAFLITGVLTGVIIEYAARWAYAAIVLESIGRETKDLVINVFNLQFFLFIWTVLYFAIKAYFQHQNDRLERAHLARTAKESQLNTLKGQMNPHFMFNSLNNIRGLMLEDVPKARDMLTKLSEMLRYSLSQNGDDTIELSEEMQVVKNYIALAKIQLEERLQCEYEIDKGAEDIHIPPMLVQLLVENAIKHGISNKKEGGTVTISARLREKVLEIEVTNPGKLGTPNNSTQLGLKNIEERLKLLYGNRADFTLSESDGLVHAIATIPKYD